jgi:Uma2 family endonuclease
MVAVADEPRILLEGVDWECYEKFLDAVGKRSLRLTYDRGRLEIMSPLPAHEVYKALFGWLLAVLAEEMGFPFKTLGSTTFRRRDALRGLEPDNCFYLKSAKKVRDWLTLDLRRDPPPDLAIEVDITSSSLDRLAVYAALGVPEVWRFDGKSIHVYVLDSKGAYVERPRSAALPFLPMMDLVPLLQECALLSDDREVLQRMRKWVRRFVSAKKRAIHARLKRKKRRE